MLIDDLRRQRRNGQSGQDGDGAEVQPDLFADFNGLPSDDARTEFYQHDANWSNRMILGDSLQVMASLAEREGLRGKVQCIYLDPPYGIKFNSNFQWSTTSRDVKDGKAEHISREPEQVKAFRDTWRDGVHSYLTCLRDRLTVARELLAESGSVFVQIGDENVHLVRALIDEVFGSSNFVASISFKSTNPLGVKLLPKAYDYILWYASNKDAIKFRPLVQQRDVRVDKEYRFLEIAPTSLARKKLSEDEMALLTDMTQIYRRQKLTSSGFTPTCTFSFELEGKECIPFGRKSWATNREGIARLKKADRLFLLSNSPYYKRYYRDAPATQYDNTWTDQPAAVEEGVPDLVEGRWRLLPDCDIGRVFMRKGAATDEETLQDRARHIHGQQPGAGGLAGEGRATAGAAGRVAGEGGTGHRRSDRRHGPGDGRSGAADERRGGGGAEGAGAPRSRPGGVLAWRAGRPGSAEGTAVAGRQAAAAQETAACRRVGRGRGSGLHGAAGRPAAG